MLVPSDVGRTTSSHDSLLRIEKKMQKNSPVMSEPESNPPPTSGPEGLGYTLWMFDGAQWQLKKDCALEGGMVSPPPSVPGKFKGQLRAIACVAA